MPALRAELRRIIAEQVPDALPLLDKVLERALTEPDIGGGTGHRVAHATAAGTRSMLAAHASALVATAAYETRFAASHPHLVDKDGRVLVVRGERPRKAW